MAGPPEIYGSLATVDGFVNLVTGAEFRGNMHFFSIESLVTAWHGLPAIVAHVLAASSAVFLVGGVLGLALLARRDPWLALLMALLAASGVYFLANYVADLYHYLLVGWLVLAVGVALSGEWLVRSLAARVSPRAGAVPILMLLLPLSILIGQWPLNDQSTNVVGERFSEKVFSLLPPNAVLLTYWDTLTTLSYKHCMEGVRPDVTLRSYDPADRVTCDRVAPLEDEIRRGRPVYALFARPGDVEPLRRTFDLIAGPTLDLPYGQRYLDYRAPLFQVRLKGQAGS